MSQDLSELVSRAAHGDRDAFTDAYRRLQPLVARFVSRRVGSNSDVEEIVARTFERMIERLATFDTRRGSAEAWVLTMARSLVIDHHRRARKVVPLSQGPSLADTTFQALELVLAGENERRLHALVLQAAPADRELLTLRYGDDLCHGEIAAILEIEEATVRKRLSRIVGRLREAMRDQTTRSPGEEVDCAAQ